MKRWLVLTLGLGMALIAGWALLADGGSASRIHVASGAPDQLAEIGDPPQHPDIDKESRDRLREILLNADSEEVDPR